ncbi:MAG: hypothetical protein DWI29_02470, partial [Planctomycetota bacterium]
MRNSQIHRLVFVLLLNVLASQAWGIDDVRPIDFNRDIRPILSDNCYTCHGPDEQQRVNDLRLDRREVAFSNRKGHPAIVPGDVAASLLHQRVSSSDPEKRMPPRDSGRELTDSQIQLLTEWIRQGAEWTEHWAFVAPKRPALPETQLQ